jgi:hypothetical protein
MLNNCHNMIIFKDLDEDRLKHLYGRMALKLPYDKFLKFYNKATVEPHSFLLIDKANHQYYKNLDQRMDLV